MLARRSSVELIYNGKNITANVSKDLESFSYCDNASSVADDISVTINDQDHKWVSGWFPQDGDRLQAKIKVTNWNKENDTAILDCGTYVIDQPEFSGPPSIFTLKAISIPSATNFKDVMKSKVWKDASVKKIAQTIADNSKITLNYSSKFNPKIKSVEQSEQSDMDFLQELCKNNGLVMKVFNSGLVIFSEQEAEEQTPVLTITPTMVDNWNFQKKLSGSGYDGCRLKYSKKKGHVIKYEFFPDKNKKTKVYEMNESVEDIHEAEILVKSKLRELNREQISGGINLKGHPLLVAGICILIKGFGAFDGKYFIDSATHDLSSGYKTSIKIHKVLKGY